MSLDPRHRYRSAAAFLGVTQEHLRKMVCEGTAPPHYRLGARTVVFWESDLAAWLHARRVAANPARLFVV